MMSTINRLSSLALYLAAYLQSTALSKLHRILDRDRNRNRYVWTELDDIPTISIFHELTPGVDTVLGAR